MPRPPNRPSLKRERIEVEALDLIDRAVLDAFSMRRLGQTLGLRAMSLYHHFRTMPNCSTHS